MYNTLKYIQAVLSKKKPQFLVRNKKCMSKGMKVRTDYFQHGKHLNSLYLLYSNKIYCVCTVIFSILWIKLLVYWPNIFFFVFVRSWTKRYLDAIGHQVIIFFRHFLRLSLSPLWVGRRCSLTRQCDREKLLQKGLEYHFVLQWKPRIIYPENGHFPFASCTNGVLS